VQLGDASLGEVDDLVVRPELDRVGRAGLRARRLQPVLQPVIAEGALRGAAVDVIAVDDAERARRDAVPAAVADVRLEDDRVELGPDQRAGRARVEAAGVRAVLAHVGHEDPRGRRRLLVGQQLDEPDVPPRRRAELVGEVVGRARLELGLLGGQVVPLLARDLARLAPDAHRRVGEEPHPLCAGALDRALGHGGVSFGYSARRSSSFAATA
jgi:hypothetical protein